MPFHRVEARLAGPEALGILVPPIGAIILVDQYVIRKGSQIDADWRGQAFCAWACGSVAAFIIEKSAPEWSTAISAFLVAGVVYLAVAKLTVAKAQAS